MQCHPLLSSIIWIPLMFSRCCSGRREINHIRHKNTFTSQTVSTREGLTCRLYSLARLALQPLHFLAGFWCFTLLSRLWKHFKTPPDKPPRSGRVGGANRWGRKRMARKKKKSLIIHLRDCWLCRALCGFSRMSKPVGPDFSPVRTQTRQRGPKWCQALKHVSSQILINGCNDVKKENL